MTASAIILSASICNVALALRSSTDLVARDGMGTTHLRVRKNVATIQGWPLLCSACILCGGY